MRSAEQPKNRRAVVDDCEPSSLKSFVPTIRLLYSTSVLLTALVILNEPQLPSRVQRPAYCHFLFLVIIQTSSFLVWFFLITLIVPVFHIESVSNWCDLGSILHDIRLSSPSLIWSSNSTSVLTEVTGQWPWGIVHKFGRIFLLNCQNFTVFSNLRLKVYPLIIWFECDVPMVL